MKKLITLLFVILLACIPIVQAGAEEAEKTVDGDSTRWEQESTSTDTLATMTWNQEADALNFSGTGYRDRVGMKFGFRCNIAFDVTDVSVTLKFPETFNALYSDTNNMHFAIALTNSWSRWWNTDSNDVKSTAFIVRPQEQDKVSVELAGRWAMGAAGYGDVSGVQKTEFTLDEARTMELGFREENGIFSAYVNDTKFADLSVELKDGNTMSDYFADFNEGKGYLQFGATVENDTENVEISYSIVEMHGALDAFKEPEVSPPNETDDTPPVVQEKVEDTGSDFNANYLILYGTGGCIGVAALVCWLLCLRKRP